MIPRTPAKEDERVRAIGPAMLSLLVAGCALLAPLPGESTLDQRLAAFPTRGLPLAGKVTVSWDAHQIPFIEAECDEDAAFVLGLVHAHLRLGQLEILRRISQGRIAEMGGPLAADIDHGLRILRFGRAAPEIEAALPAATRAWLEAFVRGINHYQQAMPERPHEFRVLGLEPEPWTVADILTFGRLAGTDVNWLVWASVLRLRARDDWPQIWARLVQNGAASVPSFAGGERRAGLDALLGGFSRSGSNSLAVAPVKRRGGGAILANDPHLGIFLPNFWLLVGIKSPSYHAVGLMAPGLPLFAIGRNPWIAWGGTNMRAASSELYDVSKLDPARIAERRERIAVRWWFDREVTVRETEWGPILSDAPQLEGLEAPPFALKWTGHQASDEVSAMLAVARARDFAGFRAAFEGFAVPGQNMLYADAKGNIGQVMAVRLPVRNGAPPADVILDPAAREKHWASLRGVADLPFSLNPAKGYLVSANNRPADTDIHVGYFFSPDDRVERMAELLEGARKFLDKLAGAGLSASADGQARAAIDLMASWDGHYRTDSRGAVAFELFHRGFGARFYEIAFGEADWAAFANVARIKSLMMEDIARAAPGDLAASLEAGLEAAAKGLDEFSDWGAMHRLGLAHPLVFLPLVGGRYRFADVPIGGSTDTIMKTAHGGVKGRHYAGYGSNARHISDLSDPDANYFVLLGGQDGWLRSSTFLDQLPLWLEGDYVQLPLRPEAVRARFPHRMELSPQ
jgi:penicillin amidase